MFSDNSGAKSLEGNRIKAGRTQDQKTGQNLRHPTEKGKRREAGSYIQLILLKTWPEVFCSIYKHSV